MPAPDTSLTAIVRQDCLNILIILGFSLALLSLCNLLWDTCARRAKPHKELSRQQERFCSLSRFIVSLACFALFVWTTVNSLSYCIYALGGRLTLATWFEAHGQLLILWFFLAAAAFHAGTLYKFGPAAQVEVLLPGTPLQKHSTRAKKTRQEKEAI